MGLGKLLTKETLAAVLLASAVAVVATAGIGGGGEAHEEGLQWENTITIHHNGELVEQFHNTLADQGKNFIRDKIVTLDNTTGTASNETLNATWISLGNGTTVAAGDTILNKEITSAGLERDNGAVTTFAAGEFQVQHQFTATSDIGVVNTTGLNWNSTGPSLISGGQFSTDANILNGDSLTVTHNITIS